MSKISQEKLINNIRAVVLEQCVDIKLLYLYGSDAQGAATSESDINKQNKLGIPQ
jgi:predicted nucleotidyltransferase